ncbi:MAG: hypothetical protein IIT39_14135, partial [Clostridia bacterium]|nr:hypothetical protein [Clostridia bacterium]
KNLMAELEKINRIINRELPDADKEVLLVLDATTGQNAVNQTKEFKNAADITGIVLTKLDGTAKGGVVLAIKEELNVPVKYIGVGEQIDDLQPFEPDVFARALFGADDIEEVEEIKEEVTEKPVEDEELKPATADIWAEIDAQAEAERLAEAEKEKAKTEEEVLAEEQAKVAAEAEKAEEKKKRAEERKNRAKKYNWSTEQTETTPADDDWFEQWKQGKISEE